MLCTGVGRKNKIKSLWPCVLPGLEEKKKKNPVEGVTEDMMSKCQMERIMFECKRRKGL